jgi:hypothetical protein
MLYVVLEGAALTCFAEHDDSLLASAIVVGGPGILEDRRCLATLVEYGGFISAAKVKTIEDKVWFDASRFVASQIVV